MLTVLIGWGGRSIHQPPLQDQLRISRSMGYPTAPCFTGTLSPKSWQPGLQGFPGTVLFFSYCITQQLYQELLQNLPQCKEDTKKPLNHQLDREKTIKDLKRVIKIMGSPQSSSFTSSGTHGTCLQAFRRTDGDWVINIIYVLSKASCKTWLAATVQDKQRVSLLHFRTTKALKVTKMMIKMMTPREGGMALLKQLPQSFSP